VSPFSKQHDQFELATPDFGPSTCGSAPLMS
jgi:hypothetical protein